MSLSSIGDMRQHFQNLRSNTMLKSSLHTLVAEMTTGQANDLTAHLGVGQTRLTSVDRQLQMIERAAIANTETSQLLSTMQNVLGSVEGHRGQASATLLTINSASSNAQISDAAEISQAGFEATVQALNSRFGDRAMFGGNETVQSPLSSAEDMLTELRTAVTGLTTAADVASTIEDWFDTPAGGFETLGYLGDTAGYLRRTSDTDQTVEIDVRADDPAMRKVMISFAKGVLAADQTLTMTLDERQALQQQAGVDLLADAVPLAGVQARLGYAEGQVEEGSARLSTRQSSLSIARNDLVSVDPFETASRLEKVQLQLETHYTLTARLSRLSLTEYLR